MDLSPYQIIWIAMAAIVVVGWLVVSFSAPGRGRTIVEWCSASAMYVGLFSFFVYLTQRARAADNTVALVAFGFLCLMFGIGLVVSLWHTLGSLAGEKKAQSSATN